MWRGPDPIRVKRLRPNPNDDDNKILAATKRAPSQEKSESKSSDKI